MEEETPVNALEAFEKGVLACVQDINALLPDLSRRYDMGVIVGALAEHMGSALLILQRRKLCDVKQTGLIIKRIEDTAFMRKKGKR